MFDDMFPIVVLLGIIAIALFGGTQKEGLFSLQNVGNTTAQGSVVNPISPNASSYSNQITLNWGSDTDNPNQEYIEIEANDSNASPIDITGWRLTNTGTNYSVIIPQSTNLYSPIDQNDTDDVVLYPGYRAFIVTGTSPLGYGMRSNKCSGYLSQNNNFSPYLYTSCPTPEQESKVIPQTPLNNNCFDLINQTAPCTVRTQALDNTYTSECQEFFNTTLTYQGCVDEHKNDNDFYSPKEWYVYLHHDTSLWNVEREVVTLYDTNGRAVATVSR